MINIDVVKVPGKPHNEYARCGNCRIYLRDRGYYFLIYSDGRKIFNNGYDSIECAETHLRTFHPEGTYKLTYVGESEQETR